VEVFVGALGFVVFQNASLKMSKKSQQQATRHKYKKDCNRHTRRLKRRFHERHIPSTEHLLLDSVPNLGPHIPRCKIDKFENC
jgi:hypothetical protein